MSAWQDTRNVVDQQARKLTQPDPGPRAVEPEVRVPGPVGRRPAVAARALPWHADAVQGRPTPLPDSAGKDLELTEPSSREPRKEPFGNPHHNPTLGYWQTSNSTSDMAIQDLEHKSKALGSLPALGLPNRKRDHEKAHLHADRYDLRGRWRCHVHDSV